MDFKITNNEDDSIKVQIEFSVHDWDELMQVMSDIDNLEL